MSGLGSQESVAVGGVNTGVAGQLIVALAPAALIVGGVLSRTVIVWLSVPGELLQASAAFQVLVSESVPAQLPGVVTSLTTTIAGLGSQVSVAVGGVNRSEERRVGKEWRSRWSPYH